MQDFEPSNKYSAKTLAVDNFYNHMKAKGLQQSAYKTLRESDSKTYNELVWLDQLAQTTESKASTPIDGVSIYDSSSVSQQYMKSMNCPVMIDEAPRSQLLDEDVDYLTSGISMLKV
jgi:hypothetical protein